jgi:sugar phosphate isomerase/epimerase
MTKCNERISRREVLLRAAMVAGGAIAAHAVHGYEKPAGTIGLGFSLYGMRALTVEAALDELAKIGYDCVELPVMKDWPADSARFDRSARRRLREQLAARGLRLTSLMENLPALGDDQQHRANLDRLQRTAEIAGELEQNGSQPLIETILGGKPGEFETVKERLVERLKSWAKIVENAGIVVAIKAHVSNATQRPEQLIWLLDQVGSSWLVAAYDYSHFQLQGLEMKSTLNELLPRSRFIHVKDGERRDGKTAFLLPGEGTIDYVALLKAVAALGYRGDVVVEVSSQVSNAAGYDPLSAARKCYRHLAEAFSNAGIDRG